MVLLQQPPLWEGGATTQFCTWKFSLFIGSGLGPRGSARPLLLEDIIYIEINLQAQFEQVQQGGGFDEDQTATVAFLGYKSGFSDYTGQAQLTDQEDWYISKTMYRDKKIDDNKFSFYMMAGKTQKKLQEMIRSQYEKGE